MAFAASQRVVYKIGSVNNWLQRTDLQGRRICLADFDGKAVGRGAALIARVLQGKDRPDYKPEQDGGDVVVVINASKAVLTGKKMEKKQYFRHSGKPGNLKTFTPKDLKEKFGVTAIIWNAVNGMVPKNRLRSRRMDRVLIYENAEHDFDARYMFKLDLPSAPSRPSKHRWKLPEGFEPVNAAEFYCMWRGADKDWAEKLASIQAQRAAFSVSEGKEDARPSRRMMRGLQLQ